MPHYCTEKQTGEMTVVAITNKKKFTTPQQRQHYYAVPLREQLAAIITKGTTPAALSFRENYDTHRDEINAVAASNQERWPATSKQYATNKVKVNHTFSHLSELVLLAEQMTVKLLITENNWSYPAYVPPRPKATFIVQHRGNSWDLKAVAVNNIRYNYPDQIVHNGNCGIHSMSEGALLANKHNAQLKLPEPKPATSSSNRVTTTEQKPPAQQLPPRNPSFFVRDLKQVEQAYQAQLEALQKYDKNHNGNRNHHCEDSESWKVAIEELENPTGDSCKP